MYFDNFNSYVKELSIYSSWSTGMAFWKEHYEDIKSSNSFNELFPHIDILFERKNEKKYIVDDTILLTEMQISHSKKGKYDLFHAFAVEYISIILELYRQKYISYETFKYIKKQNLIFIRDLYFDFVFMKKPCSYDISNFKNSIKVYYSKIDVKISIPFILIKRIIKGVIKLFIKEK